MFKQIALTVVLGFFAAVALASEKIVSIDGMTCESCAQSITSTMKSVDGVKSCKVSVKDKTAAIIIEDGKNLSNDDITKKISKLGYKVTKIEEK